MSDEKPAAVTLEVQRIRAHTDPHYDFFEVTLRGENGVWPEIIGTESELRTYLRGIQATASLFGAHVPMPEIPREPTKILSPTTMG